MSLTSVSVWNDSLAHQLVLISDHWPTVNKSHHKRDVKLVASAVDRWVGLSKHLSIIVEQPDVGLVEAKHEEEVKLLPPSHARLSGRVLLHISTLKASSDSVGLQFVESQHASVLIGFLVTAVKFWAPLGDKASPDQDQARIDEFLKAFPDTTWTELFAMADRAVAALTRHIQPERTLSRYPHAVEFLRARMAALETFRQAGDTFRQEFAQSLAERYSVSFFNCVERIRDEALARWTAWAESFAYLVRDFLFWDRILSVLDSTDTAGPSSSVVLLVEHNVSLSCAELLPRIGFRARSFLGTSERVTPTQVLPQAIALDERLTKQTLFGAFDSLSPADLSKLTIVYFAPQPACSLQVLI